MARGSVLIPLAAIVLVGALSSEARAAPGMAPAIGRPAALVVSAAACSAETMSEDTYRAFVKGIQAELALHGYDAGPFDGELGARTVSAIRHYQRDAGLAPSDCPGRELLDHLKFVLPKVNKAGRKTTDTVTLEIQEELTRRGYYVGPVDGTPGSRTREAAKRFVTDAHLVGDGAIDRRLLNQLREADPGVRAD